MKERKKMTYSQDSAFVVGLWRFLVCGDVSEFKVKVFSDGLVGMK